MSLQFCAAVSQQGSAKRKLPRCVPLEAEQISILGAVTKLRGEGNYRYSRRDYWMLLPLRGRAAGLTAVLLDSGHLRQL